MMVVSLVHPITTPSPMVVVLLDMVIDVSDVLYENAKLPILVTLLGITTDTSDLQDWNAPPPILVTLLAMIILVVPLLQHPCAPGVLHTTCDTLL